MCVQKANLHHKDEGKKNCVDTSFITTHKQFSKFFFCLRMVYLRYSLETNWWHCCPAINLSIILRECFFVIIFIIMMLTRQELFLINTHWQCYALMWNCIELHSSLITDTEFWLITGTYWMLEFSVCVRNNGECYCVLRNNKKRVTQFLSHRNYAIAKAKYTQNIFRFKSQFHSSSHSFLINPQRNATHGYF